MKVCLQAGHNNCQYNSILSLRKSTGAPNEMTFNVDIRDQVAGELRVRGFEVATTDANANDDKDITTNTFDLFLSIHYDADVYKTGGGFVDFPEPSTDGATQESQRIAKALTEEYFKKTLIVNHPERSNKNTRYFYMWKYLTSKTPCVLIECGVGMHVPDDWQTLHFNRPLVVEAIVAGICKAFNVPYELPSPQGGDTPESLNAKIVDLSKKLADEIQANAQLRNTNLQLQSDMVKYEEENKRLLEDNHKAEIDKQKALQVAKEAQEPYQQCQKDLQAVLGDLTSSQEKIVRNMSWRKIAKIKFARR